METKGRPFTLTLTPEWDKTKHQIPGPPSCPGPSPRTAALWRGGPASASSCRHFWGSPAALPWWWSSVVWSLPPNRLETSLQASLTYIAHTVLTGSGPSAFAWGNMRVKWSEWECIIVLVHLSRCPAEDINLPSLSARGMELLEPHHIRALLDFT